MQIFSIIINHTTESLLFCIRLKDGRDIKIYLSWSGMDLVLHVNDVISIESSFLKPHRPYLRNHGRDISFQIFTRKEVETKRIGKKSKQHLV